ncbi:hypothetical protein J2S54_003633 [Streptomyces sp. DSM 42143]|uniref:hypothetical protein n=1 Tax=Streptomyces TaxID=1883 RepID=UPI002782B4CF|nr:hypothetical protein [Streptomyces sp. DSM 42143]MDQ0386813.1 hypothetical protein [Streptomyces sp. DSM 42143]
MLVILLAALTLWSYMPFRNWVRTGLRAVKASIVRGVRRRRRKLALRYAEPLLKEAEEVFPRVASGRLPPGNGLTPEWIVRWWHAAQVSIPVYVLTFVLMAAVVWNAEALFMAHPRSATSGQEAPNPWRSLVEGVVGLPRAVEAWKGPADAFEGLRGVLVLLVAGILIPLAARITAVVSQRPEQRERRAQQRRIREKYANDYWRCWPVVVLVLTAVTCAREYKQLETAAPGDDVPRVSLRAVERILWQAPRTRRGRVRVHQERVTKAHIARVVGALRAAEAQQDSDPKEALQDLTVMLLTIAERYAEGKVSELLDEDQIGDVEPAAHREHLRVVAVGGVVVVTMTGAALAGLPEAALSALLPIVVIVVIILLYREKGPTPSQLRDLVIPR